MPGITLTIELDDAAVQARLSELIQRLEHPEGLYKNVGEYMTGFAVPRNFATATSPDGGPWAPLSPVTIARRAKAGKNTETILQVTRHLAASIVSQVDAAGLRVGSPVEYAGVMQFGAVQGAFGRTSRGGPIPWGTIPGRPFLGISEADETEIVAIARAWLGDGW